MIWFPITKKVNICIPEDQFLFLAARERERERESCVTRIGSLAENTKQSRFRHSLQPGTIYNQSEVSGTPLNRCVPGQKLISCNLDIHIFFLAAEITEILKFQIVCLFLIVKVLVLADSKMIIMLGKHQSSQSGA